MSNAEQEEREWRFYIQDMIEFSEKVLSYTEGLDQDEFIADELTYDATLRNLELIGEAATHIPSEVREAYPDIPWRAIVGTRNRLAHSYLSISNNIIWTIIREKGGSHETESCGPSSGRRRILGGSSLYSRVRDARGIL